MGLDLPYIGDFYRSIGALCGGRPHHPALTNLRTEEKPKYWIIALILFLRIKSASILLPIICPWKSCAGVPGIFELFYIHNEGAAFSFLQGQRWFFIVITLVALLAFISFG